MHGNVSEWVQDRWHDDYDGHSQSQSAWEAGGTEHRVYRGGSWYDTSDLCSSFQRDRLDPCTEEQPILFCDLPLMVGIDAGVAVGGWRLDLSPAVLALSQPGSHCHWHRGPTIADSPEGFLIKRNFSA